MSDAVFLFFKTKNQPAGSCVCSAHPVGVMHSHGQLREPACGSARGSANESPFLERVTGLLISSKHASVAKDFDFKGKRVTFQRSLSSLTAVCGEENKRSRLAMYETLLYRGNVLVEKKQQQQKNNK